MICPIVLTGGLRLSLIHISINSSAVKNPDLVNAAAEKYGSQCVVVAIDARANAEMPSGFEVYVAGLSLIHISTPASAFSTIC